ncbi:hypothetical protein HNR30_009030 [Nonomuraea soli]|uniref:Albumin domain-containing protein n=1 Tax=Nonomuraea soli TaxID=1032476 RepID=A0A7W0CUK8_9ACTN|nr:hypothetical protein [Nonomuraea soli]
MTTPCCSAENLQTCCAAEAKTECCGTEPQAPTGCGCQ